MGFIYSIEILQDAWLDSIDVHQNFAARTSVAPKNEDEAHDLSSEDIGKIKRRIADALQPGETVKLHFCCLFYPIITLPCLLSLLETE